MSRGTALVAIAVLLAGAPDGSAADDESDRIERGEYLVHAAGCVSCHTDPSGEIPPMAGGRALETPFGTFYTPNITPDPDTGIGDWADSEFVVAMWSGLSPDRRNYYPAFPYTSYTGMSEEDVLAIKAYLFSLEPVVQPNKEHELPWYLRERMLIGAWKGLYFRRDRFVPDPEGSDEWNRGAYLVRHLGHCGECHTPRNFAGATYEDRELAGNPAGPEDENVPNITPGNNDGIGTWSAGDIEFFLELGMLPNGDFAGKGMDEVIEDNTSTLTPADREAVSVYLQSLPALPVTESD